MSVYTKTGDKGNTSLFDGSRVSKTNPRINLLGNLDELNSHVGVLISNLKDSNSNYAYLLNIQNTLFNIGSEIADPKIKEDSYKDYSKKTVQIEENIDNLDKNLEPLRNFILPGGSKESAYAHICRTVTRRCERLFFEIEENNNTTIGNYLNRLSDYFFVLARVLNKENNLPDVLWKKE